MANKRGTYGFGPDAAAALVELHNLTGQNETDCINRAVRVLAYIEREQRSNGKELALLDRKGNTQIIKIF